MNWGVLGTAKINEKVLPLLKASGEHLRGLASRSPEKAQKQASELGIEKIYSSYEALLEDPSIHAVYNSLPNSLHAPWTLKALARGKHVLCEKPLAMSSREAFEIESLATQKKVLVMEGLMYRHHPQMDRLKELVPSLGPLRTLKMSFHTVLAEDSGNIRWSAELGGGALWDLGCYVMHCLRSVSGKEATSLEGRALWKNGVDQFFWGMMKMGSGCTAFFDCGFNRARRENLEIVGEDGIMLVERPIKAGALERVKIMRGRSDIEEIIIESHKDPYAAQVENFLASVRGEASPKLSLADSCLNTASLEALFSAAKR
jgi:xylose dehydrogenase (NAD/NADP)